MHDFVTTRIHPLSENVFNEIIEFAGGKRAHPDHDRRDARNADYILGEAVIELKILDDESLSKGERQARLAALFVARNPDRPVYVLDRATLELNGQRAYDRAMEGPIKGAVKSAKGQLVQSRAEFPETKLSILMLVNNANTALGHDEIVALVGRRGTGRRNLPSDRRIPTFHSPPNSAIVRNGEETLAILTKQRRSLCD